MIISIEFGDKVIKENDKEKRTLKNRRTTFLNEFRFRLSILIETPASKI